MSQKIRCANPTRRRSFVPDPRLKNHRYYDRKECRRFRRRRWQSEKMKTDPDYRKNVHHRSRPQKDPGNKAKQAGPLQRRN